MTAIVGIISISITLHNYLFFPVVGIIKFWYLSRFDDYNTVALSIFTVLSIISLGFTYYY